MPTQPSARPDVWHVASLWVATAALAVAIPVVLCIPLEIDVPVNRGARAISTIGFTVLLFGLVFVSWHAKIRRRVVHWHYLAIGLLLLLVTWSLIDGALRELAANNLLWAGVSGGLGLAGMVLSDALLWRGLRRNQDTWSS